METGPLSVSLSYIYAELADDGMVNFRWETAIETSNAGFNLYVEGNDAREKINTELILSSVVDSVTPTEYSYSAAVEGDVFYIEFVGTDDTTDVYGPFPLNTHNGALNAMQPAVWLPIVMR